jgi:hypothetical protein
MPAYAQALRVHYTPIPGLFLRAVGPCTGNRFPQCRRDDRVVLGAVVGLAHALERVHVPAALARGDRELRGGLASLDAALRLRIRLASPATIEAFIRADFEKIVPALNQMDRAAADLNKEAPALHLRPV